MTFLGFILDFVIDLYYSRETTNDSTDYFSMILKLIGISLTFYFLSHEIASARKSSFEDYISDGWNLCDFALFASYIAFAVLDYFFNEMVTLLLFVECSLLLLMFIKLNFYLRIFEGFSFLVSMMQGVFLDLRYFMVFFIITVIEFGMLFSLLISNSEAYNGIGNLGYFIMAFRTSAGDFDMDNFGNTEDNIETILLRWFIWIIGVLVMNVIFMNFIIAVISESYEKVMQKLIAESYRVKVEMIAERELFFKDDDFKTDHNTFPKYLILRRSVEGENSSA